MSPPSSLSGIVTPQAIPRFVSTSRCSKNCAKSEEASNGWMMIFQNCKKRRPSNLPRFRRICRSINVLYGFSLILLVWKTTGIRKKVGIVRFKNLRSNLDESNADSDGDSCPCRKVWHNRVHNSEKKKENKRDLWCCRRCACSWCLLSASCNSNESNKGDDNTSKDSKDVIRINGT